MGEAWAASLKSHLDHQQSVKYKSTIVKTLWPAWTATSTKDRWIGTYSIGQTIPGKLICPNNNNKKISYLLNQFQLGINSHKQRYNWLCKHYDNDYITLFIFCYETLLPCTWVYNELSNLKLTYHTLLSIVHTFYIKYDAEIFPAHFTWKVAEKR